MHAREVPEHLRYTRLQGALKKEAQQFEYNLIYIHSPSYEQLHQALLENYGETAKMFYFELSELRQGEDSIALYSEKFRTLVSKAKRYLPIAFQEVEMYIKGV